MKGFLKIVGRIIEDRHLPQLKSGASKKDVME
jgi:hypothetical protein